ncbi:MAG: hypothetical protein ACKOSS_05605 [Planctomycetia bacterium]
MGCGKTPYPSREQAQRRADVRTRADDEALRVYHCRGCDAWHITSQPERDFVTAPTDAQVDEEVLLRLRHAAARRRPSPQGPAIAESEVQAWTFTRVKASAHARRQALQRLHERGALVLEAGGTPQARITWVLPPEDHVDAAVLTGLRRALQARQHGNPLVGLALEEWIATWAFDRPPLPPAARRDAIARLLARGLLAVEDAGSERARVTWVAPQADAPAPRAP